VSQAVVVSPSIFDQPFRELLDCCEIVVDGPLAHSVSLQVSQESLHTTRRDVEDEAKLTALDDLSHTSLNGLQIVSTATGVS